jgi:hypothetical protein
MIKNIVSTLVIALGLMSISMAGPGQCCKTMKGAKGAKVCCGAKCDKKACKACCGDKCSDCCKDGKCSKGACCAPKKK